MPQSKAKPLDAVAIYRECAEIAVRILDEAREEGESDLRQVRHRLLVAFEECASNADHAV